MNLDCVDEESRNWGADAPIADILELNTWYYIVIYYNPRFKHEYVNEEGEQRQASSVYCLIRDENFDEIFASRGHTESPPTNSNGLFRIGFGGWGDSYFDGWIDELRISNSYRKYRDDVLANVDVSSFKDSVFLPLKDRWTVYQWPLAEYFPFNNEKNDIERENACGPTMLTRAIHYWEYPRFPKGIIEHNWAGLDWYANYDETEYLWDQMPPFFIDNTEEEYGPAALLSAQVGVASLKTYDNMYCMPKFLKENFRYSKKTRLVFEEEYTKEEWENIIKNELNNGRICMVGGWGHYYLINGYNSKNEFFTDYSFNDVYWKDIKEFDFGDMQDMIIYFEPAWNDKTIEIITPTENSHLKTNSEIEIKWESTNISNVILEYSDDAGKSWDIITESTDASTGNYLWTTPDIGTKKYKIRISDTEDLNIYRRTSEFEVYENKQFEFKNPTTSSVVTGGMQQPIYWETSGITTFKLEYSTNNGENWLLIQDSVNSKQDLNFIFPIIQTNEGILRATDLENGELTFLSGTFNISNNSAKSFQYNDEYGTELLMHFENNLENAANSNLKAFVGLAIGDYIENYDMNLGKAYQIDNRPKNIMANFLWIKNSENLDLGNNWTMETWAKLKSIGDENTGYYPVVIEKEDVVGIIIDQNYAAFKNGFHAYLNFADGSNMTFFQNQSLDFDKWYHVSLISDSASQTVNFFVHDENRNLIYENFQPFPEGSNGILKQNQNQLKIGGTGGPSNRYFDGFVDEIRVIKSSTLFNYLELTELPFSDDFEEQISDDATFTKWTTQNMEGWHFWHMVDYQGINSSQCMRFENTDIDQNDWLITKPINTSAINRLNISFDNYHVGAGMKPKLLYKVLYTDGTVSDWIELEYSLSENENEWHNTGNLVIDDLGDAIYFAFQAEFTANGGIYFLMDNFNVTGTITGSEIKKIAANDFKVYPNP
ncbi:MAG: C10 family peptidase, partial [Prolixibacteraceae bacterium]|nr:C10 family peptidase [Prolixibacteraceae bacterium]